MTDDRDLPEGVIDADPPGGWESADAVDGETAERGAAAGSPDDPVKADEPIESDEPGQIADPDLASGYAARDGVEP